MEKINKLVQTGEEMRRNIQSPSCFIYTCFHLYAVWQPNCTVIHLVYCVGGYTALQREEKNASAEDISKLSSASPRRYQKPRTAASRRNRHRFAVFP